MAVVEALGELRFCPAGLLLGKGGYDVLETTNNIRFVTDIGQPEKCIVDCLFDPENAIQEKAKGTPEVYFNLDLGDYHRSFHAKLLRHETEFEAGSLARLRLIYEVVHDL